MRLTLVLVLVGEIIGASGARAPWSFLIAAVVAGFTAKSYGELAAFELQNSTH